MKTKWAVTKHIDGRYAGQSRIDAETANQAIEIARQQLRDHGRNPGEYMLEVEPWSEDQDED